MNTARLALLLVVVAMHAALMSLLAWPAAPSRATPRPDRIAAVMARIVPPQPAPPAQPADTVAPREQPRPSANASPEATPARRVAPLAPAPEPALAPRAENRSAESHAVPQSMEMAPAETVAPAAPPPSLTVARAAHASCVLAPYPLALLDQGIEGLVRLRILVDAEGRAAQVQLLASSGWRLFDDAALTQARGCRFVPARLGSQPVDSWVEFPMRFALNG